MPALISLLTSKKYKINNPSILWKEMLTMREYKAKE